MSHQTKLEVKIKSLTAVAKAAAELGFKAEINTTCRGYYGNLRVGGGCSGEEERFPMVLSRSDCPYGIALRESDEERGTFTVQTDFWGGSVEHFAGNKCSKLLQLTATHAAIAEAELLGYCIERDTLSDGSVRLICTKYA